MKKPEVCFVAMVHTNTRCTFSSRSLFLKNRFTEKYFDISLKLALPTRIPKSANRYYTTNYFSQNKILRKQCIDSLIVKVWAAPVKALQFNPAKKPLFFFEASECIYWLACCWQHSKVNMPVNNFAICHVAEWFQIISSLFSQTV